MSLEDLSPWMSNISTKPVSQGDDQTDAVHTQQEQFDHSPLWPDFCRLPVQIALWDSEGFIMVSKDC